VALHDRVNLLWMQEQDDRESLCEWAVVPAPEKIAPWGNRVSGAAYYAHNNGEQHDEAPCHHERPLELDWPHGDYRGSDSDHRVASSLLRHVDFAYARPPS
jgi:hypothetical protein